MNRRLKALGLALFATLALGAVAASAASAATDHITVTGLKAGEKGHLTAESIGKQVFTPTTKDSVKKFECSAVAVDSTVDETNTEVTATPTYSGCKAYDEEHPEGVNASVTSECDYRFTGETTTGNPTEDGEHATVHLINHEKPGEPCHIHIKVTALNLKCASVPNQEITDAVRYENFTSEDIRIKATAHGFESTTTNSIGCPTKSGGTEVHPGVHKEGEGGLYTGTVTVKAHNDSEVQVPIQVTST